MNLSIASRKKFYRCNGSRENIEVGQKNSAMSEDVMPFLKWPGGKRWLTSIKAEIFPVNFHRYIEPFLGGGSIFFKLNPSNAILSDLNVELINCYRTIKSSWKRIQTDLSRLQQEHSAESYYRIRGTNYSTPVDRAVRLIYLNRTCFNGIYRENRKGEFNVPIGTKTSVLLETDNFRAVSRRLKNAVLSAVDFECILSEAAKGDFVFVDPPYTVSHNNNGFIKYNDSIFQWSDQIRLRDAVKDAKRRGAKILVLNANHSSIHKLYDGVGKLIRLHRTSKLAADPSARVPTSEVAITINY